jgi:DNA-binding CsgD family transcriptional regulator
VLPGFAVTADNRDAVVRLCQRLDGIPLAIELASARLKSLSEAQILARLEDRFGLLTTGPRSAQPRQRTLRGVVAWSFDLCSRAEQALWARASVFAGGFELEAAELVCADEEVTRERVMDVVASLVDKSILTRHASGSSVRYLMLDTLREYGFAMLAASGKERAIRGRHRDHFDGLATRRLFGPQAREQLDRLRVEHANLRAALEFCASDPVEAESGLAMGASLWQFWEAAGAVAEGRAWLGRLLDLASEPDDSTYVRATCIAGWLALLQNDISTATAALDQVRPTAQRVQDESAAGYFSLLKGVVASSEGRDSEATAAFEGALDRFRTGGDHLLIAVTLRRLALAASATGDHDRAIAWFDECLRLCDEHDEQWVKGYALWGLGLETWHAGDAARAGDLLRESIAINRSFGDRRGVALAIEILAWVAAAENKGARAAQLLGAADTIWRIFDAPLSGFPQLAEEHRLCEQRARSSLGEATFDAAYRYGAALAPDEAADHALGSSASHGPPPAATPRKRGPLTRRESEIAGLVAQGLSNREIASQLVISERTAEAHVEHILTKLGFRSRTQIAAWLVATQEVP